MTKTTYLHLKNITRIKGLTSQQDLEKTFHSSIFSLTAVGLESIKCFRAKTHFWSAVEPPGPLRSSGTGLLPVPRVRTKHGDSGFSFYPPHIWNKLPESCRSAATLGSLKSSLKTCSIRHCPEIIQMIAHLSHCPGTFIPAFLKCFILSIHTFLFFLFHLLLSSLMVYIVSAGLVVNMCFSGIKTAFVVGLL